MKRMRVLFGQRRMQLLVTAAVLLLAAGVVVGSGANFSTSAASADNVFTAGFVSLTPTGAALNIEALSPGHYSADGTLTVRNSGNVSGDFYITSSNIRDTITGPGGELLSDVLEVEVLDFANETLYGGPLADMTAEGYLAGSLLPGAEGTITVRALLPDSDATMGGRGSDNAYQNTQVIADLLWTVVSN